MYVFRPEKLAKISINRIVDYLGLFKNGYINNGFLELNTYIGNLKKI